MTPVRRRKLSAAIAAAIIAGVPAAQAQIDLSLIGGSEPGFKVLGDEATDALGTSVSGAGDVDGDGLADVVVGAPLDNGAQTDNGSGHVIFGDPGNTSIDVRNVTAAVGIDARASETSARAGTSVSGAGDVNGDGFMDFVVGAPRTTYGIYNNAGSAFVVFGSGSLSTPLNLDTANGFRISGYTYNMYVGTTVSGAGDVNGDGFDDLIVSAPATGSPPYGYSHVIFGANSTADLVVSSLGVRGFSIVAPPDSVADDAAGIGDFNGDGLADVAVLSRANDQAYIVFGKPTASPVNAASIGTYGGGVVVSGADLNDAAVAGAGDVNGDGYADLIIGAPDETGFDTRSGVSYVIFGRASPGNTLSLGTLGSMANPGFVINGPAQYEYSGRAVAGAGDFDGDGLGDLLVGMPDNAYGQGNGQSFVVFGKADFNPVELSTDVGEWVRLDGEAMYDRAGVSLSSAGDVNGDGLADLLIGAKGADVYRNPTNFADAGKAYVVFSAPLSPPSAFYKGIAGAGNPPKLAIGTVGDGSNASTPDSRFWIDFSNGTGAGPAGSSEQGVTLHRSAPAGFTGDASTAGVYWEVSSDRTSWTSALFTFKYLDFEVAGFDENLLSVFRSASPTGPWEQYFFPVRDTARNKITHSFFMSDFTPGGTYFALGTAPEIQLARNDSISDGASDPIGNRPVGPGQPALTYQVENSGTANLTVSTAFATNLVNVANVQFTAPMSPVAPEGGTTSFDVNFDVVAPGAFSFDMHLPNGDSDEGQYDISISGTGTVPEIDVLQGVAAVADGGTDNIGSVNINTPFSRTYTIENNGMADLNVGSITWTNLDNVSFPSVTVTTMPDSIVPPGGMTSATIQFDVLFDGPFTMDLDIANGDSDENPYDITITGTGTGGIADINLLQDGIPLSDGASDSIGNVDVNSPVSRIYTIENTGTSNLTVGAVTASALANVTNFTVTSPPAANVAPGGSTSATVQFDVIQNGAFSLDLDFASGDPDENPYDIAVSGSGTGGLPEIDIQDSAGVGVADGGSKLLGELIVGRVDLDFTIQNTGTGNLDVSAPTASALTNVSGFDVKTAPTTPVPPGGSTTVAVSFFIDDFGAFSLDLGFPNTDSDENPYDFTLSGTGTDTQTFPDDGSITMGDQFGSAVAGSGNLFAVGIPGEAGDPGKVIVYLLEGTTLTIDEIIPVPAGYSAANFGASLAMEGDRLLIGAPGDAVAAAAKRGAKGPIGQLLQAALYQRQGNSWTLKQPLSSGNEGSSSDGFGASVAMDGNTLVVGAPADAQMGAGAGAAYLIAIDDDDNFVASNKVTPSAGGGGFGSSVAASGGKVGVGAPSSQVGSLISGSVTMFQTIAGNVMNPQSLGTVSGSNSGSGDQFGSSIAMDGNMLLIGSPGEDGANTNQGAAYLFQFGGSGYNQTGTVQGSQSGAGFGTAVGMANGQIAVGAPGMGNGAVASYSAALQFLQMYSAKPGQTGFGQSLSLHSGGLIVGAPQSSGSSGEAVLVRDPNLIFRGRFEQE